MSRDISQVTLRPGTTEDVPAVLRLVDIAIEWLVSHGRTSQWGTEPRSKDPARIKQATEFAESGGMWLAVTKPDRGDQTKSELGNEMASGDIVVKDGEWVIGALTVGDAMSYVTPATEPELYIKFLITDRSWAGSGLGTLLLDKARELARQANVTLLRVDCFAGQDQKLVKYYESQGFVRTESFERDNWQGQILVQRLNE
ncbi:putative gcn5-related n-acetyltransferase protein [Phaeoacremonium minimum UCRPA7]|uniref:Putative gcn5-related n-acetyltransferase protein n=1 Tax=Phaeoacremonium minimum (strain UCR-PA7) TaxID=1286976 RepID=R8BA93_PHAM7|nr:putative gcn5-related n-acetyltransferase protein [Phaeoacremonium minimum UCRPA7]EON96206.1 putative gcn5-related n-acetyltransferase protein [Phaeoacremonium minimum UCRPA7]